MPAMAAHYITFLAKYVPSCPHQPTAVFLGVNGKDTHYLSGIYGIYTIPAQKSVLSPKYEKPDTGQQTPDTGNSKSEIFWTVGVSHSFPAWDTLPGLNLNDSS